MRRRLILSTAVIALAAVVVLGVPLAVVETSRIRGETASRLEREADEAAGALTERAAKGGAIPVATLRRVTPEGHRTIVTAGGRTTASGPPLRVAVDRARNGSTSGPEVVAEAPAAERDERIRHAWLVIALLAGGGVLTAVALAGLQARRLARPLEALARDSARLGDGDFSARAGLVGVPEFDAVARGLNGSAARIAELVAREREFTGNVSHQLRTPLTALRLRLEEAARDGDGDGRRRELGAALAEADRLEDTIASLLAYAREGSAGGRMPIRLGNVLADHVARWRPILARAGRSLRVDVDEDVDVIASPGTLGQIVDVLLENALHHGAGPVAVRLTRSGSSCLLRVADAGPGIAPELRGEIFRRGTSGTGSSGIGLHLAHVLARGDGGTLRLAEGSPTCFELRLPATAPARR